MSRIFLGLALASATVLASGQDYIIEARSPGLNFGDYSDTNATFKNSSSESSASGLTTGNFSFHHDVAEGLHDNATATFAPSGLESGINIYKIYYTAPSASSVDAPGVEYDVNTATGIVSGTFDATSANAGNTWYLIGEFTLDSDNNPYIFFDTANVIGNRFYSDAVKFEFVGPAVTNTTVEVDGAGPDSNPTGPFRTLAAAVAYTNTLTEGDNVINITTDALPDTHNGNQIQITAPVTINGDGNQNEIPCDILVDIAGIRAEGVVGEGANRSWLEIKSEGTVVVKDLRIHPDARGNTTVVDAVHTYNPDTGTGDYHIENVWVGTSTSSSDLSFVNPATAADLYNLPTPSTSIIWYGYLNSSGIFYIADGTGTGASNVILENCRAAGARSHVLNITKVEGDTTVIGGFYGHAGTITVRVVGQGVTFTGSPTNRVEIVRGNRSSAGEGFYVGAGAQIDLLEYVDSHLHTAGTSAFAFYGGTVDMMRYCRGWNTDGGGTPFWIQGDANVTASDITIHASGDPIEGSGSHSGSVSISNSIITSSNGGGVDLYSLTASYAIENSALPTDGQTGESLSNPALKGPATVTTADNIIASPLYSAVTYTLGEGSNYSWLRPSNVSDYSGAAEGGANLTGGAGGTEVPVSLSGFTIE